MFVCRARKRGHLSVRARSEGCRQRWGALGLRPLDGPPQSLWLRAGRSRVGQLCLLPSARARQRERTGGSLARTLNPALYQASSPFEPNPALGARALASLAQRCVSRLWTPAQLPSLARQPHWDGQFKTLSPARGAVLCNDFDKARGSGAGRELKPARVAGLGAKTGTG